MADSATTPLGLSPHTIAIAVGADEFDEARERRNTLKSRHSHALVKLLDERDDLRGVHPLADLVADSLRWSA